MKRLLDDARPGMRYSDTRGAVWEYKGRYGSDEDFVFPHILVCIDTDQQDDFSPDGYDEYVLARCKHRLVWAVCCR